MRQFSNQVTTPSKSMEFGTFYKTSYLDANGNTIAKPIGSPSSPNLKTPTNFMKPSSSDRSFKTKKSKRPGMLDILSSPTVRASPKFRAKSPRSGSVSPERPTETKEVIKMSHYPSAEVRNEVAPIERADWPAPPATVVDIRNLVRARLAGKLESPNKNNAEDEVDLMNDPKLQRELDEISKIHNSAMVEQIRLQLVQQLLAEKKKGLDPRSSSRTPSAKTEPVQPPRFVSPVNASPSRNLVDRPRGVSDSEVLNRERSPVVHATSSTHKYRRGLRPGYGYGHVTQSLSTVPAGTPGAYVYDLFAGYEDSDDETIHESKPQIIDIVTTGEDNDSVFESPTRSRSSVEALSVTTASSSPILRATRFKRTSQLNEPSQHLPYDEIRLNSANRKKGLSESNLEKYLTETEFLDIFGTSKSEFYKMAEFKRNDLKKKVHLL